MSVSPLAEVLLVVAANGMVAWALTYLLHSTTLMAWGWLIDRALRLASIDRVRLWRTVIAAPFLTSAAHVAAAAGLAPLSVEISEVAPAPLSDVTVATGILAVVAFGPLALAIVWIRSHLMLRRTLGVRTPISGELRSRLDDLADGRTRRRLRLTSSDRLVVPAAVGCSEICMPSRLLATLPADEQRALLAHELGHLTRRDPLWLGAAGALACLAFFQPLNRVALRRLRDASEQAADDFAVGATRDPVALARALTTLTTIVIVMAGSASAAGSPIYERVKRLLEPDRRPRRPLTRGASLTAGVVAALLLTGLAPGVSLSVDDAANRIPWLAPSKSEPNARMLEVRRVTRVVRDASHRVLRPTSPTHD